MNPLFTIFGILAALVSIYAILCIVRIIITWIPQAGTSKFADFLSTICDPYLNLFRKIKWLKIGNFDLSPALGLCVLSAIAAVFSSISGHGFSLSFLLQTVIGLVWNIIQSILGFLILVLAVRLIIILVNKTPYTSNPILNAIDESFGSLAGRIAKTFSGNKRLSYKGELIAAIIVFAVISLIGSFAVAMLCNLLAFIRI